MVWIYIARHTRGDDNDDYYPSDEADFSDGGDGDAVSEVGSLGQHSFMSAETAKTRFTNYSMTSSVIRRNAGLTLVDDRFEEVSSDGIR